MPTVVYPTQFDGRITLQRVGEEHRIEDTGLQA